MVHGAVVVLSVARRGIQSVRGGMVGGLAISRPDNPCSFGTHMPPLQFIIVLNNVGVHHVPLHFGAINYAMAFSAAIPNSRCRHL